MKFVMAVGLVCVLALAFTSAVRGDEAAPAATAAPAAAAPAVETPATPAAKESRLEKATADVKAQVAVAEKLMKLYEDEMAKPEDKRDTKKAQGMKFNVAQAYLRAAGKAKGGTVLIKTDEKQSFLDEYEKPNREKAIGILLEMASDAKAKSDLKTARALYMEVLKVDAKNQTALDALKAIDEELKTAKANASKNGGGSEDPTQIKSYQQGYKQNYGNPAKVDWGRTGRTGW
jgi:hypothetical protein